MPPFAGIGPRYVASTEYNIRHDPEAVDKVAWLLLEGFRQQPGYPVRLGRALGTKDVWAVSTIVETLRRLGWIIDGHRGIAGYTLRGWTRPPRWQRIDKLLEDVLRKRSQQQSDVKALPGQLSLDVGTDVGTNQTIECYELHDM